MSTRFQHHQGIKAYRKVAIALAGSTILMGGSAAAQADQASGQVPEAEQVFDGQGGGDEADDAGAGSAIVVTSERDRINTLNSRLGDVQDAPQSISIISREVIEQQAAATLRDVLRNVSGISMAAGEGGGGPAGDNLTLRGFGARNDIFVDGIRDTASYTRDTFNIEQVEVVKGPASAQTGRGSTGGYINMFTKQPQMMTFSSGTVAGGLPAYGRVTADVNVGDEMTGLGGVGLRMNFLYHNADAPGRDFVESERIGFAPSFAVGLGGTTRAIFSYLYLRQDGQPDYGIPFVPATNTALPEYADQPAPVDYDNYYGLTERDYEKTRTNLVTFAVEHDVTDSIRIANATRYAYATRDSIYSSPRFVGTTTTLINPQTQSRDTVDDSWFNQTNLYAEFATGALRHDLIAGLELADEDSRNQPRTISPGTSTDLFDPDPTRPWNGTIVDTPGGPVTASAETLATYLFDTIRFSEQLLFSGGLRWERYKSTFSPAASAVTFARTDESVTWRAGLTYKPIERLSLYIGAGTSVNPSIENLTQTNVTAALAALEPEESRTYEIGAKWDGFGGRLLLNAAVFRTDKVNARTDGLPGEPATVLAGKQRVDGFELGITGQVTAHWSVIGSYSYIDSEVRESNDPAEVGNHLRNVPDHSGSLWSVYEFASGLEIGGGARYVGTRYTNELNTREIKPYWVFDATVAYDFGGGVNARLNLFNLSDERYIDQVGGGHFVPGPGRSAIATVSFAL